MCSLVSIARKVATFVLTFALTVGASGETALPHNLQGKAAVAVVSARIDRPYVLRTETLPFASKPGSVPSRRVPCRLEDAPKETKCEMMIKDIE